MTHGGLGCLQAGRAVAEVDRAGRGLCVFEILGRHRVALFQRARSRHQANTEIVGLEQSLVRIEHQRIGSLDAVQVAASFRRDRRRAAVGAIDMQPHTLALAQVGDRVQRTDCPGIGSAGGSDHHDRS